MLSPDLWSALKDTGIQSKIQRDMLAVLASLLRLNNTSLYGTHGRNCILELMNFSESNLTTRHHLRESIEGQNLEIG